MPHAQEMEDCLPMSMFFGCPWRSVLPWTSLFRQVPGTTAGGSSRLGSNITVHETADDILLQYLCLTLRRPPQAPTRTARSVQRTPRRRAKRSCRKSVSSYGYVPHRYRQELALESLAWSGNERVLSEHPQLVSYNASSILHGNIRRFVRKRKASSFEIVPLCYT